MVLALPVIARARPELSASGRYYLAVGVGGRLLGAGGWSVGAAGPSDRLAAPSGVAGVGHVRLVGTDPSALRQGVARAVMTAVFDAARRAGLSRLQCLSTRTAAPFCSRLGFQTPGAVEVPLRAGIVFPAVSMVCDCT